MNHIYSNFQKASVLVFCACVSATLSSCNEVQQEPRALGTQETQTRHEHVIPPRPVLEAPTEPELSGDARTDAVAVAKHFVMFYPYMLKTGDTSYWEKHSGAECKFCQEVLAEERNKKDETWIDSTILILDQVNGIVSENENRYEIQFLVERRDVVIHGRYSDEEQSPDKYHVVVSLEKKSTWQITNFQIGDGAGFTGRIG
ncbi:DUF6318 family protein [Arcanobacterium phocae]|uniref:DUF6318 domain-containing protein n=1 Tax=Arcanobacterium phocae TaxID=131112 RepID=A0A1H2LKM0_9ACTO|nr:DUF6318 family protein [Arcanobacterium phocae]SDU81557.1 hypothetical protein SAMN04489737_1550 [Arcanobacterium phocae]